ncbi:MAG: hypothetical protein WCP97_04355 [bacterium]
MILRVALLVYMLLLLLLSILMAFVFWHLRQFSLWNDKTKFSIFLYSMALLAILSVTGYFLITADWASTPSLLEGFIL